MTLGKMMSNYGIISRALFSEKPKLFTFEMIHSDGHGKSMKVVSLDPQFWKSPHEVSIANWIPLVSCPG